MSWSGVNLPCNKSYVVCAECVPGRFDEQSLEMCECAHAQECVRTRVCACACSCARARASVCVCASTYMCECVPARACECVPARAHARVFDS